MLSETASKNKGEIKIFIDTILRTHQTKGKMWSQGIFKSEE